MSSGYSTLANNGKHCVPYAVERIADSRGRTIYRHDLEESCKQVISPEIAHLVTAMLEKVVCCGTGTAANIGRPQAGKTGTHEEFTNAWFIGYVPQYSTAVWVGYPNEQRPMYGVEGFGEVFGGTIPALIWHDYMSKVVQGLPAQGFPAPPPPERGKVPRVVGLTKGHAVQALADANFTPMPKLVPSSAPAGTVIGQSPAAGTSLVLGSIVNVSVSNGQAPPPPAKEPASNVPPGQEKKQEQTTVKVPAVVGMSEAEATSALEAKGFQVSVTQVDVTDKRQEGIVLDQSPNGNTQAEEGSTVTITVGKFKKPGRG
jgi:membrane peptidoglycan carboxypeptidase